MADRKSILLRLDPAVHDALARWAGDEMRSTNAQIEFLLRRALEGAGRSVPAGPQRRRGRPPGEGAGAGAGAGSADGPAGGPAAGAAVG